MNDNPQILYFRVKLIESKKDNLILADLPKSIGQEFPGNYSINIEGTIVGSPFRSPLEIIDGKRYLIVNKFMLKNSKASIGDKVDLIILGPEPDPVIPQDLEQKLDNSSEAQKTWNKLSESNHRDWIRWINLAVKDETRVHRIDKAINTLSDGKSNPCCVNIYEYLLTKIKEDNRIKNIIKK